MMKYKGYSATVAIDEDQGVLHGEVLDLVDVITFQGRTAEELVQAFHDSVDDYLAFCQEREESPEKPYSGKFLVRVEPSVHRQCSLAAKLASKSLNAWVATVLERAASELQSHATMPQSGRGDAELYRNFWVTYRTGALLTNPSCRQFSQGELEAFVEQVSKLYEVDSEAQDRHERLFEALKNLRT